MTTPHNPTLDLQELHDEYVERVNYAIAEDREERAWALADAYAAHALRAITDEESAA